MGSQFPQNHYFQMYNSACLYDIGQSQQGSLGPNPLPSALINGAVPPSLPIPNPEILDAPILSEDQFNTLRRNFLAEEAKRHRRRHRSRGYSRSRSRDRYSLSRSPTSRRRRGTSQDRSSRSSRRRAPQHSEIRHRRSPHIRRHESPRLHSRNPRSRRDSGSWRDSRSPVPYGGVSPVPYEGSVSSSHKMSPYHSDNRPREHTNSPSGHRKRQRTTSEPRHERRSPLEILEKLRSPDSRSHRRHVSPFHDKSATHHHISRENDPRKAYLEDWKSNSPYEHHVKDMDEHKAFKKLSCDSTSSSRSSGIGEGPVPKRKRRPSLDGGDVNSLPTLKQSRSQGSLPAYQAESMRPEKRDHRSKKERTSHRIPSAGRKEDPRQTVHCALNNATGVDERNDRAKLSMSPEHNIWDLKTRTFLEKLGVPQLKTSEESPDSTRSKSKKSHEQKLSESSESVKCVPLMDVVVEDPVTNTKSLPVSLNSKVSKSKKDEKLKLSKSGEAKKSEKPSTCFPADVDLPQESSEPSRKRKVVEEVHVPEVVPREKKKSKKEKKEKKEKKKKKKKRKDKKDEIVIEAPTEVEILPPSMEFEGRSTDTERTNDNNSTSALIPPPSKWELELDEHMNEFEEEEEESQQERARSVTRIPSLVSSVNYRRVSVEEEEDLEPKKSHKAKKEAKRHKKKKRERR